MNKYLNFKYLGISMSSSNTFYNFYGRGRDDYYDDYYDDYPRRRPSRRDDYRRRSPNDWEPAFRGGNSSKSRYLKDPKGSSRFIFQFVKRFSEVFLIITVIALIVAMLGFVLINALPDNQLLVMQNYYFFDIVGVAWVFGSIAGLITTILYMILYVLMILNRKGWLRKNTLKSHIFWFITFLIVAALSLYFIFVSTSNKWLPSEYASNPNPDLTYKSQDVKQVIANVIDYVKKIPENSTVNKIVGYFFANSVGGVATGLIALAGVIISACTGFLFYRSVNNVLEDSFEYFDSRKRRW